MPRLRIPAATYRIQFSRDFRFSDARELVPYLHQLGITDLYSSPRYRPRRGSSHGYDVTSPDRVNPDLGPEEEFNEMCERLQAYGMGLVLDIVPNHMAASHENRWWADVLEHGPASPYADYFDIDWHPEITKAKFLQDGKVLVPVLGDMYGNVLRSGHLELHLEDSGLYVSYWERRFPIDSGTCGFVLDCCAELASAEQLSGVETVLRELAKRSRQIPSREGLSQRRVQTRVKAVHDLDHDLFLLHRDDPQARQVIDRALGEFSARPDRMHALLEQQAYRLAHWRIASEEINYRRFFDINDLVSLRVELPHVFDDRHAAIREQVEAGRVTGLRVDHVDGLYDPRAYLDRLQECLGGSRAEPAVYMVVEKILDSSERLPADWAAAGTTGYDFLNAVNDLFIDAAGLERIDQSHRAVTGDITAFAELCYACNRQVMQQLFSGEVERLTHDLSSLAARHWIARDIPSSELRAALIEITACLPVYRTYASDDGLARTGRQLLERTLELSRRRIGSAINVLAWEFLREVLLLDPPEHGPELGAEYLRFLRRWQQFTGPVMAKGLEDTAFYRHMSFISRNEVGGDPLREAPPLSPSQVHEFLEARSRQWPHSMNTTSTHDTKRSEDVRARLNVLAEIPDVWLRTWARWRRLNRKLTPNPPSVDEESMIYQALLGAWPLDAVEIEGFGQRMAQFLEKALREAKLNSNWLSPDQDYEQRVIAFAEALIEASPASAFRKSFARLHKVVAYHGAWNSLSQLLIKATAPGVPDFYQGQEMWTFHLVDPDNRGTVDYARRREALQSVHRTKPRALARHWQNGEIKLFVTQAALNFRRDHAALFSTGAYVPIEVRGPQEDSLFAFARHAGASWCIAIAPRMTTRVSPARGALGASADWRRTRLALPENAPHNWRNLFTGSEASASNLSLDAESALDRFPVAILHSTEN